MGGIRMSEGLVISYTNTATSPATDPRSFEPDPLNFGADWRVVAESAGEVVLANINAPISEPEQIRVAFSDITDVFKGTKVGPGELPADSRAGTSLLIQLTGTGRANDANDTLYPYSAHLVMKLPNAPSPTVANIEFILNRLLGALYDTGEADPDSRLSALIRGAITPVEL